MLLRIVSKLCTANISWMSVIGKTGIECQIDYQHYNDKESALGFSAQLAPRLKHWATLDFDTLLNFKNILLPLEQWGVSIDDFFAWVGATNTAGLLGG